ncbi:Anhydro-N-acetylmuramic acid kinase [Prochlorococcus sp. SS52]|nr:Anhydro-N-acetylmuramic acid kinase [Prochlorococcus sp. SS52]
MSGTSADGVDAVLVDFRGNLNKPRWKLLNSVSLKYSVDLQKAIIDAGQGSKLSGCDWLELSEAITEAHFSAASRCDPDGISTVVGCHGQTVCHRPPKPSFRGASWQLIQAPLLATLLGKNVIYDFRSKDLALGGQGAPLAPFLDYALIGRGKTWRGVLNLGGIANLSLIPPLKGPHRKCHLLGWDCGPANTLIDLAVQKITNGQMNFDCDGLMASKGKPDLDAIKKWLKEDFFQQPPPKSTGREYFGSLDLAKRFSEINSANVNDLVATITCFTACVVAQDLNNLFKKSWIKPAELFVAGGGSRNIFLMKEITNRSPGIRVLSTEKIGIPSQSREAMAFALLAWWNINQKPINTNVTGLKEPSVLGIAVRP